MSGLIKQQTGKEKFNRYLDAIPLKSIFALKSNLKRLLFFALIVFVVMSVLNPGKFLTVRNLTSMCFQFPELGLFALAIMFSLISGGIDLSIVSTANLAGIMAALILTRGADTGLDSGLLIGAAFVICIITGALCGAINGWLISRCGITPILATLGTMQLFMGIAFVITRGPAVSGYPDTFLTLGNGMLFGIPVPLLVFLGVAFMTAVLLNRTPFGLRLYLMGTNETAAWFSGINVRKMLFCTYFLSGLYAALTGLIMIARTNSAKADYGSSYLLQAILVAILGGVNPSGGFGTVFGIIIAVLSLQFLSSGFNMLHLSNFIKEFAWGAFLILVMVMHYHSHRRNHI